MPYGAYPRTVTLIAPDKKIDASRQIDSTGSGTVVIDASFEAGALLDLAAGV